MERDEEDRDPLLLPPPRCSNVQTNRKARRSITKILEVALFIIVSRLYKAEYTTYTQSALVIAHSCDVSQARVVSLSMLIMMVRTAKGVLAGRRYCAESFRQQFIQRSPHCF
jgi:hypothetical protein